MACASPSNLCATCQTLTAEQKPKQGILPCLGCKKIFCSQHMIQHRQQLTDSLQNIVVHERNVLQEKMSTLGTQHWPGNVNDCRDEIDDWEVDSIKLIKQSAASARQQLQEMAVKECGHVKQQVNALSDELNTLCENENYFEDDIERLTSQFEQLKQDLEHFPIELQIRRMSDKLIIVQPIVAPALAVCPVPSFHFVDRLLMTQKPKMVLNVSHIKPGRMVPMSGQLLAFRSDKELPTLDMKNGSWQSLCGINGATVLHWSAHLKLFLVLKWAGSSNELHQFDPRSGVSEGIFQKPISSPFGGFDHVTSNSVLNNHDNVTALTCFKQYLLIAVVDKIEKWLANDKNWHSDEKFCTRWCPPISCQPQERIIRIEMNDHYYAILIEKVIQQHRVSTPTYFLEVKSHGMATLHRMRTDYETLGDQPRLLALPNAAGWLFFCCGRNREICYVVDAKMQKHDQNIIVTSNVTDIDVYENSIFLRRKDQRAGEDIIEVYDW